MESWLLPDQVTKNEIDFIITNDPAMITNYEILSNVLFPSDYGLMRATFVPKHLINNKKKFAHYQKQLCW